MRDLKNYCLARLGKIQPPGFNFPTKAQNKKRKQNMKALRLKNLKKSFAPELPPALDDVSFSVDLGSISCLIGPSGCGKTTSLKMINRLIEPTEGIIEMSGVESHEMRPSQWRRMMGYVIQRGGLFPHLSARENVSLLSKVLKRNKKAIKERAEHLLDLVGLDPGKYKNRYPMELSGGERQRVGIARALMEDPPLLLMDEPFGALDSIARVSLRREFLELNQKMKKTILLVTHDLREAFEMGDQIILMRKGKIIQKGGESDFLRRPASAFVSDFVNEMA